MVGNAHGNAIEVVEPAAHGADGTLYPQQPHGGCPAQGYDHLRLDDLDFIHDDGQAGFNFFRRGGAVVGPLVRQRRTEFDDVGDVDHVSGESHGLQYLVEFFPGAAHKGLLLHFFIIARRFPDEHELRMGIARGKDHGVPQGIELPRRLPVLRQIPQVLQLVFHRPFRESDGGGRFPALRKELRRFRCPGRYGGRGRFRLGRRFRRNGGRGWSCGNGSGGAASLFGGHVPRPENVSGFIRQARARCSLLDQGIEIMAEKAVRRGGHGRIRPD